MVHQSPNSQQFNSENKNSNTNSSTKNMSPSHFYGPNQNLAFKNQSPTQSGLMSPRTKSPSQFFGQSPQSNKSSKMVTI